jgi:hypothetical protein
LNVALRGRPSSGKGGFFTKTAVKPKYTDMTDDKEKEATWREKRFVTTNSVLLRALRGEFFF